MKTAKPFQQSKKHGLPHPYDPRVPSWSTIGVPKAPQAPPRSFQAPSRSYLAPTHDPCGASSEPARAPRSSFGASKSSLGVSSESPRSCHGLPRAFSVPPRSSQETSRDTLGAPKSSQDRSTLGLGRPRSSQWMDGKDSILLNKSIALRTARPVERSNTKDRFQIIQIQRASISEPPRSSQGCSSLPRSSQ